MEVATMSDDEDVMDLVGVNTGIEEPELTPEDFAATNFLRNPKLGESITFTVDKVIRNKTALETTDIS